MSDRLRFHIPDTADAALPGRAPGVGIVCLAAGLLLLLVPTVGLALAVPTQTWDQFLTAETNGQTYTGGAANQFTFSGFTFDNTSAPAFMASSITATPIQQNNRVGFSFALNNYSVAGRNDNIFFNIGFTVAGPQPFTAETITMAAQFTGSGIAYIQEQVGLPSTYLDSGTSRPTDTAGLKPPIASYNFNDKVQLQTGAANAGTITITSFDDVITNPEPESYALFGCGLLLVRVWMKKKSR